MLFMELTGWGWKVYCENYERTQLVFVIIISYTTEPIAANLSLYSNMNIVYEYFILSHIT